MTPKKHPFIAAYTNFVSLSHIAEVSAKNNVSLLIVRSPDDGGDLSFKPDGARTVVADLDHSEDVLDVMSLVQEELPDAVVFSTAVDREVDEIISTGGETQLIQEMLWRHAGCANTIRTYFPVASTLPWN